jgi:LysM repeat protein
MFKFSTLLLALVVVLASVVPWAGAAQAASGLGDEVALGAAAASAQSGTVYIVRPGDTLARIAFRFNTTVLAILAANPQITNPDWIFFGRRLRIPGSVPPSAAQRMSFAAGATSATVEDTVAARGIRRYVLGAMAGQQMEVSIENPLALGQVLLVIYGADGSVLLSDHAGAAFFRGRVPRTQDYFVEVHSAASAPVHYVLGVRIPERISFLPGRISATVEATIPANGTHNFVLKAAAGQMMTVNTSTAFGQVILIIFGEDGDVLISDHAGATSWTGRLPKTQDYFIDVRAVGPGSARSALEVIIP